MESTAKCPLCNQHAVIFGTTNFHRNKAFDCISCGQFAMCEQAETRIRGLPLEFKDNWRTKILTTDANQLLVITVGSSGSGSHFEEEQVPRHTIQSPQ